MEVVEAQVAFVVDMAEKHPSNPRSALQYLDKRSWVLQHEVVQPRDSQRKRMVM